MQRAKPGVKSQFSCADYERIARLRAEGWSDERISVLYDVHRTTISRLRHAIEGGQSPADELSPLQIMMRRNDERKKLLLQIEVEFLANGKSDRWAELWRQANSA